MTKLLRNWNEIAKITCPYIKDALVMSQSKEGIRKLHVAYPECFREGNDGETDLFSWKRILQAATEVSMVADSGGVSKQIPYTWLHRIRSYVEPGSQWDDLLAIPVLEQWRSSAGFDHDRRMQEQRPIPAELIRRLKRREGTSVPVPFFFRYKGTLCVVGDISPSPGEGSSWSLKGQGEFEHLTLVPANIIRFDC